MMNIESQRRIAEAIGTELATIYQPETDDRELSRLIGLIDEFTTEADGAHA